MEFAKYLSKCEWVLLLLAILGGLSSLIVSGIGVSETLGENRAIKTKVEEVSKYTPPVVVLCGAENSLGGDPQVENVSLPICMVHKYDKDTGKTVATSYCAPNVSPTCIGGQDCELAWKSRITKKLTTIYGEPHYCYYIEDNTGDFVPTTVFGTPGVVFLDLVMRTTYQQAPSSYRANFYILPHAKVPLEKADVKLWIPLFAGTNIAMTEHRIKRLGEDTRRVFSVEYGTAILPAGTGDTTVVQVYWKTNVIETVEEFNPISPYLIGGTITAIVVLVIEIFYNALTFWKQNTAEFNK